MSKERIILIGRGMGKSTLIANNYKLKTDLELIRTLCIKSIGCGDIARLSGILSEICTIVEENIK